MSVKIKFTNKGFNEALCDVKKNRLYSVNRFINPGDRSHNGYLASRNGVEIIDDVGDTVSYAFGHGDSSYELHCGEVNNDK